MLKKKIKSPPCQLICTYDTDHVCVGCYRSAEEVANWSSYSDEQKRKVLDNTIKGGRKRGG